MRVRGQRAIALAALLLIVSSTLVAAQTARKAKKQPEQALPALPGDKRDRVVTAPASPFHNRSYWQAAAQCGGIYFKLAAMYSDAAVRVKVAKPDPAAYAQFTRDADGASKAATTFFESAERFLIADRKIARDEAVMTYDGLSSSTGDRLKTVEAASQATKPCPDLYRSCRASFPQVCTDAFALTN
jgi:hypothetical protein